MDFRRSTAFLALVFALIASSSFASPARVLTGEIRRALQSMPVDGKATLHDISLGRESLDTIELEPMEVWAKDARIIAYGPAGEERLIAPPDVKYFKGRVAGEDESAVFISMSANGTIRGMVLIGERRWNLGTGVRRSPGPKKGAGRDDGAPVLITEIDAIDDINDPASNWSCDVGKISGHAPDARLSDLSAHAGLKPMPTAGNVAGATYQLRIAIETDDELYAGFGSNAAALTTYVGDLVGKASTVYSRDLKTTLVIGALNLRTGGMGTDPWTVTTGSGTSAALAEFGTYWHNNYSLGYPAGGGVPGGGTTVVRSSAVFLSGKLFSAGVAWSGNRLCGSDFFCGVTGTSCGSATFANAYGGGYAFCGSSGSVSTTNPDPEATVNGVQYGLPVADHWILLEFMHELGHNAGGPHTQCVALDAGDQALYGTTRNFVDECYNRDGAGCYSGTTANCNLTVGMGADPFCDPPPEKGTIMSYCHNIFYSGSFRASRYLFGKALEPSEKMLALFNVSLENATPNPTIATQGEPIACSSGRTASVASCGSCTYSWQITGGTIDTATNISAITYTPTATSVTLTATVISVRGCGITASKTVTTSCVPVSPPTGVTATATSTAVVNVVWNTAAGALSYNVYRSADGTNYSLAGSTTAPTTTFNDTGRTADTAYLYKVRSVSGSESGDSNRDLATTVIFTDDPLVQFSTVIQAVHITQLRTAVNAVRVLTPLGAGSYSDPSLMVGVTQVNAAHINDLRTAIDAARANLTLTAISYGETVTQFSTTVKASHITELRNGVK